MRKFLFFSVVILGFATQSRAQISSTPPEPPGCQVYMAFDEDNDGFAQFDLDAYYIQFRNSALTLPTSYDLSGYTFEFYPSDTDLFLETNQITTSTYTNIVSHVQFCYMKFIYNGSGPFYPEADLNLKFACHVLQTTSTLATINPTKDLLSVYPNPASTAININFGKQQEFDWSIADISGKIILKSLSQTQQTIDISSLKSGIYFITVEIKGTSTVKKNNGAVISVLHSELRLQKLFDSNFPIKIKIHKIHSGCVI